MVRAAVQQKQALVTEIAGLLEHSQGTVVADYRGLNAKQTDELRKKSREAGVTLKVLKNTLTKRAAEQGNLTGLNEYLTGPSMLAFCKEDPTASAKLLHTFAKTNKELKIKGGVVEGSVVGLEDIEALATLPSREGLLSMLLSVLQAPMRNFALAVKAVAERDESKE